MGGRRTAGAVVTGRSAAVALLVAAGGLVVWVGDASLLALWNVTPLALAGAALLRTRARSRREGANGTPDGAAAPAVAGATGVAFAVGAAHLAWLLDWGGTATGSSTAGLLFVVLPVLAGAVGLGAWAVARRLR